MPFSPGDPIPHFTAETASQSFNIGNMAGRYIALAFLPVSAPPAEVGMVMAGLGAHDSLFDDINHCFFGVLRHPRVIATASDSPPGIRWFLDREGTIFRDLAMLDPAGRELGGWVILDPMLRVLNTASLAETDALLAWLTAQPPPDAHAQARLTAPVLIVPRILEPELCVEMIDLHSRGKGEQGVIAKRVEDKFNSGVLHKAYKRTVDVVIDNAGLRRRIRERLFRRLCPEVFKAFRFSAQAMDQWRVVRYDASDSGRFLPHRDNMMPETRYRQFALSINLNASQYDGGDIRFPEFGSTTYRPPTGGALVFSGSLLHEVTTVTKGSRYVFVSFLSDDQGASEAPMPLTPLEALQS